MRHFVCIMIASLFAIGCAQHKEYYYWQKTDTASALYLTGPKAQQMLEQDISECVHEIVELAKLSNIREGNLSKLNKINRADHVEMAKGTPPIPMTREHEYLRDVRVDHTDYHDFEGCMDDKGWMRVKYVHPETEHRAKENYSKTVEYSRRPSAHDVVRKQSDARFREAENGHDIDAR